MPKRKPMPMNRLLNLQDIYAKRDNVVRSKGNVRAFAELARKSQAAEAKAVERRCRDVIRKNNLIAEKLREVDALIGSERESHIARSSKLIADVRKLEAERNEIQADVKKWVSERLMEKGLTKGEITQRMVKLSGLFLDADFAEKKAFYATLMAGEDAAKGRLMKAKQFEGEHEFYTEKARRTLKRAKTIFDG